jgi:ABC-type amino acid transport substrate-binding protein
MMLNLSRTPDREPYTRFVGPVRLSRRALIVRREDLNLRIGSLDELAEAARHADQPIGIQQDAKYSPALDDRLAHDPAFASCFERVTSGTQLPRKLVQQRNLAFFEDLNYAVYHLRTDPAFKGLAIHPFQLEPSPVYLGLSKALSERASERIEAAFRRLEANGTLGHIRAKWEDMGER